VATVATKPIPTTVRLLRAEASSLGDALATTETDRRETGRVTDGTWAVNGLKISAYDRTPSRHNNNIQIKCCTWGLALHPLRQLLLRLE